VCVLVYVYLYVCTVHCFLIIVSRISCQSVRLLYLSFGWCVCLLCDTSICFLYLFGSLPLSLGVTMSVCSSGLTESPLRCAIGPSTQVPHMHQFAGNEGIQKIPGHSRRCRYAHRVDSWCGSCVGGCVWVCMCACVHVCRCSPCTRNALLLLL
jgi:hypothetical protein